MAYWFSSASGRFENGSIVTLRNGKLVLTKEFAAGDIFLVVSDRHAKWKGGVPPSPEDEAKGHWCAWLGQVPLKTNGPVKSGDYIGELLPPWLQPILDARKDVAGTCMQFAMSCPGARCVECLLSAPHLPSPSHKHTSLKVTLTFLVCGVRGQAPLAMAQGWAKWFHRGSSRPLRLLSKTPGRRRPDLILSCAWCRWG